MASPSELRSAHHREDPHKVVEKILVQLNRLDFLYPSKSNYVEWNKNYVEWRQKMLDVIKNQGLLGFIDGSVQAPPKTVGPNGGDTIQKEPPPKTVGPNGGDAIQKEPSKNSGDNILEERENEKYVGWKKSDDLVQKWIRSRLSVSTLLPSYNTAKELWEEIARREENIRVRYYLPLYRAAIKDDWESADNFIQEEQDAVRAHITVESETALIVAVKMVGGKNFLKKLVEKMSPDDLGICDGGGQTALHWAARFANIEAAKLLVKKNPGLPNMETRFKETALFYAAERGDRKMVEWLMEVTAPHLLLFERGFRILYQLTYSQLYDIALTVLLKKPKLASFSPMREEDLKFHALNALAETTSSFQSGNNFNFLQQLIYSSMVSAGSKKLTCFCHWGGEQRSQPNGTFLYHGGTRGEVLINNSSQLDELCKKICTALKIDSKNKLFFYNTMGDKTVYVKLNDQNGATRLFHLNGDNVDVIVEEEGHTTDSTRESNVFNNSSSASNQEKRLVLPEIANNVLTGGWAYAVKKKLLAFFPKVVETFFDQLLRINLIREIRVLREKKLLQVQALDLLQFLCNEVKTKDLSIADRIFQPALEQATKLGILEIVKAISEVYPYAVYLENDKKQTIFQQAIVFRQEKVFNLIHQLQESTSAIVLSKRDISNNNALHLAGSVADSPKLNVRAGAALQMQRELQWFKVVKRLAPSTNREERNNEQKTPAEVFSYTHQELMKEGEQCMKDTANSCIIVASLIATMVFAAAIQVPGGNNDNGHPIFEQQIAFIFFSIANSLALFSSIFSVIMFLSILITSPNAEEDFLFALFHEMIIGLRSLLFSLLFMMMAFGAILYLMFGETYRWILIPVFAFGCPPVYLFAAKQLPFLKDMWNSMHGMFSQQSNRVLL